MNKSMIFNLFGKYVFLLRLAVGKSNYIERTLFN